MNRRSFIKSSLGAAAFTPWAVQGRPATETANKPIKIGFLGLAHSHASGKIQVVRDSSAYELIGVHEQNPQVRRRFESLPAPFLDTDALFAEAEVIAVESDVPDHYRHARMALLAGKHVHVEKPPAATLAELEELLTLSRQKERLLQVGYMWRYHHGLNTAFEAARQGWLGDIFVVRANMNTQGNPASRAEWAKFKGGIMFELGCHMIDAIVRLAGRPEKIVSFLKENGPDDLADNTAAIYEYPDKMVLLNVAALQPRAFPHRSFQIAGTNGAVLIKPMEPALIEFDLGSAAGPYDAGRQIVPLPPYRRYVDEFVALADALRNDQPLGVSPEEELIVQETVLRTCQML